MNKIYIVFILLLFNLCTNKKNDLNEIASIKIDQKEFSYGNASLKDTIIHTFKIKNISDNDLKIKKVATSCGCTSIGFSDSIASKNEYIYFKLQYIPNKNDFGEIVNSLVVESNTNPSYTVFRLKVNIIN